MQAPPDMQVAQQPPAMPAYPGWPTPFYASSAPGDYLASQLSRSMADLASQMSQVVTATAVTQTNVGNMDRRLATMEANVERRLSELERGRLAELERLGDLRAEAVKQAGQAQVGAINAAAGADQAQTDRQMKLQQLLLQVSVSGPVAIIGVLITVIFNLMMHH